MASRANEFRELIEWFKCYYGDSWERKLEAVCGFGRRHLTNRLTGNVRIDDATVDRLIFAQTTFVTRATRREAGQS